jgi:membrane protease YdiL (CAAX protease family)
MTKREMEEMSRSALAWIKPAAYIAAASISCLLYTAFTPPLLTPEMAGKLPLIGALPGDLPGYSARFFLSLTLLGIAPGLLAASFRETPKALGINFRIPLLKTWWFWLLVPAAMAIGAAGTVSPQLAAYYPYSREIIGMVREHGIGPYFVHFSLYFVLYYIPWEFFFRGFLLFPLAREAESPGNETAGAVAALVLFQTIPSTMLHVGHPLPELLSAVGGGIAFGILAWKTRSIIPGLLLHASLGFGTDLAIVLKAAGYF